MIEKKQAALGAQLRLCSLAKEGQQPHVGQEADDLRRLFDLVRMY